jgi:hypothetical protein
MEPKRCSKCKVAARRAVNQRYCRACATAWERGRPRPRRRVLTAAGKIRATAHTSAYVAVKIGKLIPVPCPCGCATPLRLLQKHHEDYSRCRDVVFCCPTYHRELDRRRRERLAREAAADSLAVTG